MGGYCITFLLIAILWGSGRAMVEPRKFALLGIFSAIMIIAMTVEIPPFSYHFNLSVVTGVILGPKLSVLAALIVNLVLSLVGHGGITVVGLNTLTLSIEMIVGYSVFRLLCSRIRYPGRIGFISAVVGLASGTSFTYAVIALGKPWIDRMLVTVEQTDVDFAVKGAQLDMGRLALIVFGLGSVGWILEGIISGAMLSYLSKVYPDLVDGDTTVSKTE